MKTCRDCKNLEPCKIDDLGVYGQCVCKIPPWSNHDEWSSFYASEGHEFTEDNCEAFEEKQPAE